MEKILIIVFLLGSLVLKAQTEEVEIPNFDDEYSRTVKQLESGSTDIDYLKFRESFLASQHYVVAAGQNEEFLKLKEKMYKQMGKSQYQKIIHTTKKMLSIDYTSMKAHKILRQTYEIIGDTINAKKYKSIQFGLLYSIIRNGDGASCKTGWPVIQLAEEYFILEMIGAKFKKQSINEDGGICDEMIVEVDQEERVYYFDTHRIFAQYEKARK